MKKYLWIIVLLFVVIGTPNAYATSYTATFTCAGSCVGGTPTAPDVSFPSPTTITESWDGFTATFALSAPDLPSDMYLFFNDAFPDSATTFTYTLQILDTTDGTPPDGVFATGQLGTSQSVGAFDSGTLSFSAGSGGTPEPATWIYAITAVGFLGLVLIKLKAL